MIRSWQHQIWGILMKNKDTLSNITCVSILGVSVLVSVALRVSSPEAPKIDFTVSNNAAEQLEMEVIDTSKENYSALMDECSSYINGLNNTEAKQADTAKIDMSNVYVDFMPVVTEARKENVDETIETGPIYLQDKLLMRYVTPDYKVSTVMASIEYPIDDEELASLGELDFNKIYAEMNSEPEIFVKSQSEIKDLYKVEDKSTTENLAIDIPIKSDENMSSFSWDNYRNNLKVEVKEEKFIEDISDKLLRLIKGEVSEDIGKYFTEDGYTISKQSLPLIADDAEIEYMDIGSSQESLIKDRMVLGISATKEDKVTNWVIIAKLTEDYKIYDIDIV